MQQSVPHPQLQTQTRDCCLVMTLGPLRGLLGFCIVHLQLSIAG